MSKSRKPPETPKPVLHDVEEPLPLAMLQGPDGSMILGVLVSPNQALPITAEDALRFGVLLGRGWKTIPVTGKEPTDEMAQA